MGPRQGATYSLPGRGCNRWHNVIGAVMVVTVGTLLSMTVREGTETEARDA